MACASCWWPNANDAVASRFAEPTLEAAQAAIRDVAMTWADRPGPVGSKACGTGDPHRDSAYRLPALGEPCTAIHPTPSTPASDDIPAGVGVRPGCRGNRTWTRHSPIGLSVNGTQLQHRASVELVGPHSAAYIVAVTPRPRRSEREVGATAATGKLAKLCDVPWWIGRHRTPGTSSGRFQALFAQFYPKKCPKKGLAGFVADSGSCCEAGCQTPLVLWW